MELIYLFIGIAFASIVAFFWARNLKSQSFYKIQSLQDAIVKSEAENKDLNQKISGIEDENRDLRIRIDDEKTLNSRLDADLRVEQNKLQSLIETHARLEAEWKSLRDENEKQWAIKFEKLKEELASTTSKQMEARQASLQSSNRDQIGELLNPIKEQFAEFKKSIDESRTSNEVSKNEIKNTFDSTIKLFSQQQNQAVEALREQTTRIGNDAANLTKALKHDSKFQGDWGEMILDSLLESSGLKRDVHYFVQENVKDEDGRNYRPDVVVKFPEGRSIVIDSKVSLTAYAEAFETDDESLRASRLKDHARSVKKHIDELAEKKYDTLVEDAIGFVLMFIPNDQCYITAIDQDRDLFRYAYSKGIIIISPSNLMTTLHLAFNMWQQDRQSKNVETIVKSATDLYDKIAGFTDTLEELGQNISKLDKSFEQARNQLSQGKGNILRRVEKLKELGITPKKRLKGLEE